MNTRSNLARVKKLLRSRDPEQILAGVDAVVALDDDAIWDVIFDGVEFVIDTERFPGWQPSNIHPGPTIGRLVPGPFFEANSNSIVWDEIALALLAAQSGLPIRDEVTQLTLGGFLRGHVLAPALVHGITNLSNLRTLELHVDQATCLSDLDATGPLESLRIVAHGPGNYLIEGFAISDLRISGSGTFALRNLANLYSATIHAHVADGAGLASVKTLHVDAERDALLQVPDALDAFSCPHISAPSLTLPVGATVTTGELSFGPRSLVTNLGTLRCLEVVSLQHHQGGFQLSDLAQVSDLRVVDIRGAKVEDLSPFVGHSQLRFVAAMGSGVAKADVPPEMKKLVSFAKNPDLTKARLRPAPGEKRQPARKPHSTAGTAAARKKAVPIKKLLRTRDHASITQGVELALAADDDDLLAVLLDGVTFERDAVIEPSRKYEQPVDLVGRLVPNRTFTGSKRIQNALDLALLRVLGASRVPLRNEVTALTIRQWDIGRQDRLEHFPLDWVPQLPNLRTLELTSFVAVDLTPLGDSQVVDLTFRNINRGGPTPVLPSMRHLERLALVLDTDLERNGAWPVLSEIIMERGLLDIEGRSIPNLRHLTLDGGHEQPIGDLDQLETLVVMKGAVSVRRCQNLRSLRMQHSSGQTLELVDLPALEDLRINDTSHAQTWSYNMRIEHVDELPSLVSAHLVGVSMSSLDFLASSERLEHLTIDVSGIEAFTAPPVSSVGDINIGSSHLKDLGTLAELSGLTKLGLRGVTEPLSLAPLQAAVDLEFLDLRGATGITDISPLIDLPELQMISVYGSGVRDVPAELTDIVAGDERPRVTNTPRAVKARLLAKPSQVPVPTHQEEAWMRVVKALQSSESALDGIDLALTLDPAAIEYLLGQVSITKTDRLSLRKPFKVDDPTVGVAVVSRLLVEAAPESEHRRKLQNVTTLRLQGKAIRGGVPVGSLELFPKLRHLIVDKVQKAIFTHLASTKLETVDVIAPIIDLGTVPRSLERLRVGCSTFALGTKSCHIAGLAESNIELLVVDGRPFDLEQLVGARQLKRLAWGNLWGDGLENILALEQLPLEEVHLDQPLPLPAIPETLRRVILKETSDVVRLRLTHNNLEGLLATGADVRSWDVIAGTQTA